MNKREAKARKAEYSKALAEGRVIRRVDREGNIGFDSFPTIEAARAYFNRAKASGLYATVEVASP